MTIQERIDDSYFGIDVGDDMGMNPSDAAAFNAQLARLLALVQSVRTIVAVHPADQWSMNSAQEALRIRIKQLEQHGDIPAETGT